MAGSIPPRIFASGLLVWALVAAAPGLAAPISPSAPTGDWTGVSYPTLIPDYSDDQQTGITEADIVGNTTDAAVYTAFDDGGTPSLTDGNLAFRVRLGDDKNPAGFSHYVAIGIDADADGDLDLFLGVNNSGQADEIGIFDTGTDLNLSPDTTSIVSTPLQSYAEMTSNYDFSAVDALNDPTASSFDIDADGNNDFFLSFVIPFQDIVDELVAKGLAEGNTTLQNFDQNSEFQLVAGTSTQANALNQDLGGPDGGTKSTESWADIGAMSTALAAADLLPVPEPDTGALFGLGLVLMAAAKRRR
jgi:hypothetical protein